MTITPNFHAGFGTVRYDYEQNAQPGASAQLGSGAVDFGGVEAATDYLYKYALQLSISAQSAFHVYASATDFSGASVLAAAQRLYWLPSSNQNTSYGTPSSPFSTTMSPVYAGRRTAVLGYDYILRLGNGDLPGSYSASVTYTVVPQ